MVLLAESNKMWGVDTRAARHPHAAPDLDGGRREPNANF